ncbi:AraC family transcriptional regulator [Mucilaginibacter kameinonensis]|uniref:AraC family transcriptional regulator n=1 Tax=Mucilaginibacter kameinonensis TaxID=452286 RepID=UPI000EF83AE6|nr:AraC family transcriptional regulator [Mucilaginibacter kameinonensis]
MKVLQFTIPVPHDRSVIVERVSLPHHYPYLHRHKEIQLTWIRSGHGTLIVGNNVHDYCAGDVFLIGANLPHVFKSSAEFFDRGSEKKVEALTFFFNPEETLFSLLTMPEMKSSLAFLQQNKNGFKVPNRISDKIINTMIALEGTSGLDHVIQFVNLMECFLTPGCKYNALSSQSSLPSIKESEGLRIGKIYNYIMQHYNTAIALEDVADIAYMTPGSFCRYFKKHTGHTFISFLNEVRINEACKKLIAHKFESINHVAYKCGFASITNFNRVFKCLVGITPKNYIDRYNNNIFSINRDNDYENLHKDHLDFPAFNKSRKLMTSVLSK